MWPIRDFEFYSPSYGIATGGFYDVTGLVWRTTDGGKRWSHQRVAGEPVFASWFFDSLNVISVGGDLDYGAGMVQTTNAGIEWVYTYLGIWGQAVAISFRTPLQGWAPLGFAGTYMYTMDGGDTWTALFTPDSSAMQDVVFTDETTGYMVGAEGTVLRWYDPLTAVEPGGDGSPVARSGALLLETYPNPTRGKASFDFRVSQQGFVSLKVYDPLGREVATVVSEVLAPGRHAKAFDFGSLPSGVYYSRMSAGTQAETQKLVLIR
jgi:hypothetical protein